MTEITSRLSTALADRYKLERHLGVGGMATVYLAEDLKHDRKVAVKVRRPACASVCDVSAADTSSVQSGSTARRARRRG